MKKLFSILFLFWAVQAFAAKPFPEGFYLLISVPNDPLAIQQAIDNPYIDGFRLRLSLKDIQPDTTGNPAIDSITYDWSKLDNLIKKCTSGCANSSHKKVGVSISLGIVTPNWFYTSTPTVYKFMLDPQTGTVNQDVAGPPPYSLFFPWDTNAQGKVQTFINAFGARYNKNPAVAYVVITGFMQLATLNFISNYDASDTFTDGQSDGSATYHSATGTFVSGDIGHELVSPTTRPGTTILSIVDASNVTLSAVTDQGGPGLITGQTFHVYQRHIAQGDDYKVNNLAKVAHHTPPGDWDAYTDSPAGYASSAAFIEGAEAIEDMWIAAFPDTPLLLSPQSPFPRENPYTQADDNEVRQNLINIGGGVLYTSLQAIRPPYPPRVESDYPNISQAIHSSASTSNFYVDPEPSPYPPAPQPLIDLLNSGYSKGKTALELYQFDLGNRDPAFKAALAGVRDLLVTAPVPDAGCGDTDDETTDANEPPGTTPTPTPTPTATPCGATLVSNGSSSDVQAKINAAATGDTVTIPAGGFTWTSGVTCNKAIRIRGEGSGRVIARSTSAVPIGTGSKTFIVPSGLPISVGKSLKIERTGTIVSGGNATGTRGWMQGTVTSYSGTTLVMNITSSAGSGAQPLWIISTLPTTTIINSAGSSTIVLLTENVTGSVEVSGIFFQNGTGTGDQIGMLRGGSTAKPILIHDCYFQSSIGTSDCIQSNTNRGVIWSCSFSALPFSMQQLAIHHVDSPSDSWTTAALWGANDPDGTHELFIEDCDFHAWLNATDFDSNARTVMRHCLLNEAGIGTHGADTGNYGQRYFELYDSEFAHVGFNDGQTLPNNWWFYIRGGTFVVTDCVIPQLTSGDYPSKPTWNMTVMNLQRSSGPNPCWGANIAGIQYPCPRQAGLGRVTGAAGNDSITYVGDSEPIYLWNNTGTGATIVGLSDYGGTECSNVDSTSSYIQSGRDYFSGTAKPSYTKYTYPHPLRSIACP